jgi:hypothetical protein
LEEIRGEGGRKKVGKKARDFDFVPLVMLRKKTNGGNGGMSLPLLEREMERERFGGETRKGARHFGPLFMLHG